MGRKSNRQCSSKVDPQADMILGWAYGADHPPDSGIPGFPEKPSKNPFWDIFRCPQKLSLIHI